MTPIERAICQRLRKVREDRRLPKAALAVALGISWHKLASIEYARNPLRYQLADHVCRRLNVSQQFLAEGSGPESPYRAVHPSLQDKIPSGMLFSEAFKRFLKEKNHPLKEAIEVARRAGVEVHYAPIGIPPDEAKALYFQDKIRELSKEIPSEHYREFLREFDRFTGTIYRKLNHEWKPNAEK
jgi:hypothetical protein